MFSKSLAIGAFVLALAGLSGQAQAQYYYPTASYPVYAAPAPVAAYSAPVYYSQPVYAQPTYVQPAYVQPVYAAPAYAYAPYAGYYSPFTIGFNFGFGGRRWH